MATRTIEIDVRSVAVVIHEALSKPGVIDQSAISGLLATWTTLAQMDVDYELPVTDLIQRIHDDVDDILNGDAVLTLKGA